MKRELFLLGVVVCLSGCAGSDAAGDAADPIVDPGVVAVTGGLVSGVSVGDTDVRSYKGIPFAAPPVGELRWRPPSRSSRGRRFATQRCSGPPVCNRSVRSTTSTGRWSTR